MLFESDLEKYGGKMIKLSTVDFKGGKSTSGLEVGLVEDVLASLDLVGLRLEFVGGRGLGGLLEQRERLESASTVQLFEDVK